MSMTLFDATIYAQRLNRVHELLREQNLDAAVFGTGPDLQYLLGSRVSSHERLTALVVPANGAPTFILPTVERGELALCAVGELDCEVRLWEDGTDAHQIVANAVRAGSGSTASKETTSARVRLGIGSSLTADHLIPIQQLTGAETVLANAVLKELFMRKDAAEVDQLRAAGAAIDEVFAKVPEWLKPGRTESAVADDITAAILQVGHSSVDFVIVGSGPNGANPHHDFSDRVIKVGDTVVIDIGGTWGAGYHSDSTRTFTVGKPADDVAAAWDALRAAQEAAVAAVKPGVTAAAIDDVARAALAEAGYGEYFIHRTGHGIGLSTHEEPFIMAGNELVLEEGMAFSVEPGIYVPDKFGMRLEDILVVTANGSESMNHRPHELITVGLEQQG